MAAGPDPLRARPSLRPPPISANSARVGGASRNPADGDCLSSVLPPEELGVAAAPFRVVLAALAQQHAEPHAGLAVTALAQLVQSKNLGFPCLEVLRPNRRAHRYGAGHDGGGGGEQEQRRFHGNARISLGTGFSPAAMLRGRAYRRRKGSFIVASGTCRRCVGAPNSAEGRPRRRHRASQLWGAPALGSLALCRTFAPL